MRHYFRSVAQRYQRGFTLVELLVAMSIIAILAGFVTTAVFQGRVESRDMSRRTDLEQIKLGLKLYKEAYGEYPDYPQGIELGVGLSIDDELARFLGGEVRADPLSDGAGGTYGYWYSSSYLCNGRSHVVVMARTVEQPKFANYESTCGSAASSANIHSLPFAQTFIPIAQAGMPSGWTPPPPPPPPPSDDDDDSGGSVSIPGCTDPGALNYISEATVNDGSCIYGSGGGGGGDAALATPFDLVIIVN